MTSVHAGGPGVDSPGGRAPDVHDQRRRVQPEGRTSRSWRTSRTRSRFTPGDTVVVPLRSGSASRTRSRSARSRTTRCRRSTSADAGAAAGEHRRRPRSLAADAAVPKLFPQGPGDAIQSVANPCYQQSGSVGSERLPELPARAAGLQRDAVVLQQRLAELGPELDDAPVERDLAGHVPLHVRRSTARTCPGRSPSSRRRKTIMSPSEQYALGEKQLAKAEAAARAGGGGARGRASRRSRT